MIMVTGATGFLGGHLVSQLLEQGERVRILCRFKPSKAIFDVSRTEVVLGDITVAESLDEAVRGVDQIYHVAGRVDFGFRAGNELLAVNEEGTRNVLAAAERHGVERVVHVSSVSAIGATADPRHPLSEDDFGRGLGMSIPYPRSKHRGEKVALEFAERGLPVVIANPTFFIGPGDLNLNSARTILSFVLRQLWAGLTTGGLGLTDVRDVATGIRLAMQDGQPGRRYILGGHNFLLHEYHALLGRVTGVCPPRMRIPWRLAMPLAVLGIFAYRLQGKETYVNLGDIRMAKNFWLYDYTRAREELGLVCRPPEEAVRDTLAWLKDQGYWQP